MSFIVTTTACTRVRVCVCKQMQYWGDDESQNEDSNLTHPLIGTDITFLTWQDLLSAHLSVNAKEKSFRVTKA